MRLNAQALGSLSPAEQSLFTLFGCGESRRVPFSCVHHAFEYYASSQPSAVAVEHLGDSISYAELDRQSSALAYHLRNMGIRPGTRVLLLVQRSIPMVIGILAILKAGGQYVPLDGGIVTQSTLEFIAEDSNASVILVLRAFVHRTSNFTHRQVVVLEDALAIADRDDRHHAKPHDLSSPDDGVYVIYTSGTTGKPKGVSVMHRNVTNLVCLEPGNVGMAPGMRVAQLLNVAFDMCAWEVLGSLSNGCTLCIRGKSSKEWRAVMKSVDIIIATPSILAPHDPSDYPNVKFVATAGEVCPQSLADRWGKSAQFFNSCGPTEITIVNTVQPHIPGNVLSIGRPTPNNTVYILDESMQPLPIGQKGIMWAGGAGITQGYINLPEKTNERYQLDPFLIDGSIMFNTGDLGRWRPDGQLEHLGRVDDQVKVKGFRVELDGVAAAMETCADVKAATVLLVGGELWGFITPDKVDIEAVRAATAKIQPYYAVPSQFYCLSDFPLTSNGKIDKRTLRVIAEEATESNKESRILIPSKKVNLDVTIPAGQVPRVRAVPLAGMLWSEATPLPVAPPPVYQKDAHASEMAFVSSHIDGSVSSSSSSLDEKIKPTDMEKGRSLGWEGYETETLPDKVHGHYLRNLRHQIFTLYRRLFGVVFVVNMAILIATIVKKAYDAQSLGLIVVADLFCAVLMRQDYVINAFFNVFCAIPASWPLSIRRVAARVYHIGGLHSGCAISGVIWLIAFTVQATVELMHGGRTSAATVAITYFILSLLLGIVAFAYPKFRTVAHDRFERTHRFLGWTAVVYVVLLTNDYRAVGQSLGQALIRAPPFWLVVILTLSIILPWTRLRKVPVRAEVLSPHAVRMYFDYVTPVPGTFTRISESPLLEWHGFATVPEPGMKGYSLVVSRAGDWTSRQIENPPTSLWVRGIPTCGVLRIVPLFRRLVFVATGSGIGPCAPCILEKRIPIRLLWTSPNVRKTFGDKLVDSILEASPGAVIYDTRTHGKPDMVKLTYRLVREFEAEAVCVISNQKLTRKIVYGMMSRGIPAFGAIWDS
ncbi:nonribosomal peptide synthetase 12 [Fomitiporia mediterranea MF3/22]|uniref:nonribosomal peptide synthetase 12 n=1 Tax=Fomitiporia mediterranea (strain MF3/22) TaxID=694068 RepID=UPI00044096D3|nr:nonribosomal peptide synthetase 12 [Fomitiporia mediterranea MF3/22]EJC98159.1 nonribosomal peptide synthetase 12 [Fomitiporia mediterranea MF3/22]